MISRYLGSWPGIVGVWAFCAAWMLMLGPATGWEIAFNSLTAFLSVAALTFTQLVLREQRCDTLRWDRKMDELIHAVPEADNSVAGT